MAVVFITAAKEEVGRNGVKREKAVKHRNIIQETAFHVQWETRSQR